jgi:hypothetical protein
MAQAARAHLETLLRERRLDRTLTSARPPFEALDDRLVAPTGIAALDARLAGGLPRGQISECVGPRSSGRTSLLQAVLSASTARGEIVAHVDPVDSFDVESARAGGVDVSRLLWIRGQASIGPRQSLAQEWGVAHAGLDRALKALALVLQTGNFGVVSLDLVDVPSSVIRRLPFTTWLRVQRLIEATETVCLILSADPVARSAGGLTLAMSCPIPSRAASPLARAVTAQGSRRLPEPTLELRVIGGRFHRA